MSDVVHEIQLAEVRRERDDLRRDLADAHAEVARLTLELDRRHHDKVAAELRAERLRAFLDGIRLMDCEPASSVAAAESRQFRKIIRSAESLRDAPPPDLEPLRDLVRAVRQWDQARLSGCQEDVGNSEMGLGAALDTLLDAYPFLDPGADPPPEATE